jgi:hypothetical protein
MKKKQKYQEINVPASGKKQWYGGVFTVAFIYAPEGNFVLKGFMSEVEEYVRKHFTRYLVHYVLYYKGKTRTILHFSNSLGLHIESPNLKGCDRRTRYEIYPYGYYVNPDAVKLKFKRLPQYWLKEYDYLIDKYKKI